MTKSATILSEIREQKDRKQSEFESFTPGNWPKRAALFEPLTEKEMLAWRVGFLRGIEEAEFIASELLYPTIETDND